MCLYNVCICLYNSRIFCIGLYILQTDKYRVQCTGFNLNWGFIAITATANDESMCSVHDDPTARAFPMNWCTGEQQARAVGWSWTAFDSVKLAFKGCLIALCISLGLGLNQHRIWWAESAWVNSYDWNTMLARPGGPRDMVLGVYFKL